MKEPTPELLGKLAAAVGNVMRDVGAIQKTGQNTVGRGYSYASDADLAYGLQPAMAKHGLVLFPHRQEVRTSGAVDDSNMRYRVLIVVTWMLIHTGGGWIELQTTGEGADPLDKAGYKAQTGALKYALRQLFLVPTGDDPERDPRNARPPESDDEKRKRLLSEKKTWSAGDKTRFLRFLEGVGIDIVDLDEFCAGHKLRPKPGAGASLPGLENFLRDPEGPGRRDYEDWKAKRDAPAE